jgi:hypothetical protein
MAVVKIGGSEKLVSPFNGRKAIVATRILQRASSVAGDVTSKLAEFRAEYRAEHTLELDRAQAQRQFRARVVHGTEAAAFGVPDGFEIPSPIAHLTEEDWERSGHVLRIPEDATWAEEIAAVLPVVYEAAEEDVLRLLALGIVTKDELRGWKRDGGTAMVDEQLLERGEDLLDDSDDFTELIELAIAVVDVLRERYEAKADTLGPRMGTLLSMVGLRLPGPPTARSPETPSATEEQPSSTTPSDGSSTPKPTSSTASPAPTDGTSSESSTTPAGSSSSLSSVA